MALAAPELGVAPGVRIAKPEAIAGLPEGARESGAEPHLVIVLGTDGEIVNGPCRGARAAAFPAPLRRRPRLSRAARLVQVRRRRLGAGRALGRWAPAWDAARDSRPGGGASRVLRARVVVARRPVIAPPGRSGASSSAVNANAPAKRSPTTWLRCAPSGARGPRERTARAATRGPLCRRRGACAVAVAHQRGDRARAQRDRRRRRRPGRGTRARGCDLREPARASARHDLRSSRCGPRAPRRRAAQRGARGGRARRRPSCDVGRDAPAEEFYDGYVDDGSVPYVAARALDAMPHP